MSISYLSYETITNTAADGSDTITIPVGTDFILVIATAYESTAPTLDDQFDLLTIDGEVCTHIGAGKYVAQPVVDAWYWVPDTDGSVTIAWETDSAYSNPLDQGRRFMLLYFSGVDQADPIRDYGGDYSGSTPATITPACDSSTTDMLIGCVNSYQSDNPDIEYDGMNVILETTTAFNYQKIAVGYRSGTGASEDNDMSGDYPTGILISIKAASGTVYNMSMAESSSAGDAIGGLVDLASYIVESNNIADSFLSVATFIGSISESNVISDLFSSAANFIGSLSESGSITDSQSSAIDFLSSIFENMNISDNLESLANMFVSLSESNNIQDTLAAIGTFAHTINESATIEDAFRIIGGIIEFVKIFGEVNLNSLIRGAIKDQGKISGEVDKQNTIRGEVDDDGN